MNPLAAIVAGLKAVAAFFGWKTQRDALQNTAAMQAARRAAQEQAQVEAATRATAAQDVEATRKQLSEN